MPEANSFQDLQWVLSRISLHRKEIKKTVSSEHADIEQPVCCIIKSKPVSGTGLATVAAAAVGLTAFMEANKKDPTLIVDPVSWCRRCARDVHAYCAEVQWGYP